MYYVFSLERHSDQRLTFGIVNGPGMTNVGRRYVPEAPRTFLPRLQDHITSLAEGLGIGTVFITSNHEGILLDWLDEHADGLDGLLVNPAGATPYGYALRNAIMATGLPTVEIHMANVAQHNVVSLFSPATTGVVHGFREHTYAAGLVGLAWLIDEQRSQT